MRGDGGVLGPHVECASPLKIGFYGDMVHRLSTCSVRAYRLPRPLRIVATHQHIRISVNVEIGILGLCPIHNTYNIYSNNSSINRLSMVDGSWLMAHGSCSKARGSSLMAHAIFDNEDYPEIIKTCPGLLPDRFGIGQNMSNECQTNHPNSFLCMTIDCPRSSPSCLKTTQRTPQNVKMLSKNQQGS